LTGSRAVFFAYIAAHTTPSEEEYQRQAATIRRNLLRERKQVAFVEWMQDLRRRAKIVDYRENYFDV
jgi:hypothetical protein